MVVAERDELHAALGEDTGVLRRRAEYEVLVRRGPPVREDALEIRQGEIVVFKVLLRVFEHVAEVVRRHNALIALRRVAVSRHGVRRDVPNEADDIALLFRGGGGPRRGGRLRLRALRGLGRHGGHGRAARGQRGRVHDLRHGAHAAAEEHHRRGAERQGRLQKPAFHLPPPPSLLAPAYLSSRPSWREKRL